MPEYPDIENYVDALRERILGRKLLGWRFLHPFLLRSVDPPPDAFVNHEVASVDRHEKRIVLGFQGELFASIHLMVLGRLSWHDRQRAQVDRKATRPAARGGMLFDASFEGGGTLALYESGSKRRAAIHLASGSQAVDALRRGGLEVDLVTLFEFAERLRSENHTIKRALADPRLVSGVGNAYSDEILHVAQMNPFLQTSKMSDDDYSRLLDAAREVFAIWRQRLADERAGGFPTRVTAFHPGMAVHGRYGKPCPRCGTAVQRIRYAENESNYCPRCQTGGVVYADRSLSRLLKSDWPRTVEELENRSGIRY